MKTIWQREMRSSLASFAIWTLAVGGMGLACILLYMGMEDSIQDMAEGFAAMGSFSEAFGMNTLSIATLKGYFATEVGTIHSLGSGMFAAAAAITILSKEENNHSAEFLMALPVSRYRVVFAKVASVLSQLLLFNACCGLMYIAGFCILGEELPVREFVTFMGMQLLMNVEIASLCILISSVSKENKLGIGMGVALLLYSYDLITRVVSTIEDSALITPYSFSNASEILAGQDLKTSAIVLGVSVIIICISGSFICYGKKDLKS